jgi:hypothetical protein
MAYLCNKLIEYEKKDKVIIMQKMWSALTCDVITEYMFGFNFKQLESEDFVNSFHQVFLEAGIFSNIILHFPLFGTVC